MTILFPQRVNAAINASRKAPHTSVCKGLRRRWLGLAMAAFGGFAAMTAAGQDRYPSRPITLVVPYAAGGVTDVFARRLAQRISVELKQTVIVDNRLGAAGSVGTASVARAKADGYTLLVANQSVMGIDPVMRKAQVYDPLKDFTPISSAVHVPMYLLVSASEPIPDFKTFVDMGKRADGKWSFGSAGVGSWAHLLLEKIKMDQGIKAVHVPYKGNAPVFVDLISGQLQFAMDPAALPQGLASKIRMIASSAKSRYPSRMDVPTFTEQGYNLVAEGWTGIVGPHGLPDAIRDTILKAMQTAAADPEFVASLAPDGFHVVVDGPRELARRIRVDLKVFEQIKRDANLQSE